MLTINTSLAERQNNCSPSNSSPELRWFNLSSSPFDHVSPNDKNLFSPSLTVEMLSPPRISEEAASPRLWEIPCKRGKPYNASVLRDCYLHEVSSNLESVVYQALHVLRDKTDNSLISKYMDDIIDNAIASEIRCSNLNSRQLHEIRKRLEKIGSQSLSSSAIVGTESTE